MYDDVGTPPPLAVLLSLMVLVVAVLAERAVRRRLAARVPPLPSWLPLLVSAPVCLAVFALGFELAGLLYDLL